MVKRIEKWKLLERKPGRINEHAIEHVKQDAIRCHPMKMIWRKFHFDRDHWFIESKPPQMMRQHLAFNVAEQMFSVWTILKWCFCLVLFCFVAFHSLSWSNVNNTNICHLGKMIDRNASSRETKWTEEKKTNHPNRTSNVHGESCQKRNLIHTVTAIQKPLPSTASPRLARSLTLYQSLFEFNMRQDKKAPANNTHSE